MKNFVVTELKKKFNVNQMDIGEYGKLKKGTTTIEIECYDVEGIGRVSVSSLKSMFNTVKMDFIVVAPLYKDMPMLVYKKMNIMKANTLYIDLFDIVSGGMPQLYEFNMLNEQFSNLTNYEGSIRFCDDLRMAQSVSKRGAEDDNEYYKYAREYFNTYIRMLDYAANDAKERKQLRIQYVVESVINNPDSFTDNITKLVGIEKAKMIIEKYIFSGKD